MKRVLIISALAIIYMAAKAQVFYSNNQQLIKDIVINSIFIIEQSYQLEDSVSHQRFGRNNQPEFGKKRFIAVKSSDGFIAPNDLLSPWLSDPNCTQFLSQYKGVVSKSTIYEIADTISSSREITIDTLPTRNQLICSFSDSLLDNEGFSLSDSIGKINGWLVWLVANNDIERLKSGDDVSYQIYKKQMDVSSDSIIYEIESLQTEKKVIGGIYIVPGTVHIGYLEYLLCGLIIKDNNSWKMVSTRFDEPVSASEISEQPERVELTPVNNQEPKNKNKKNKNKRK